MVSRAVRAILNSYFAVLAPWISHPQVAFKSQKPPFGGF
jgi:hypothetical protein